MSDPDDPFPLFDKPATKGDVVSAMIWTQALVGKLFGAFIAGQIGDIGMIDKAVKDYDNEVKEYMRKYNEIVGRKETDG